MRWSAIALCSLALSCSKPASTGSTPSVAPSKGTGLRAEKVASLLRAELRRDPAGVAETDLVAESGALRAATVRALARIEDDKSFEALLKALADEEPEVIGWAAFGVGRSCRGHEAEAVPRLALRAASLAAEPVSEARDGALGMLALALGRCASDDAERTLRSWLKLPSSVAEQAMLGLGQVARSRKRLDDASVAALLDAAARAPQSPALHAIESLPALGAAARARLLEVAQKALEQPGSGRAFALRALAKGGPEAAAVLRRFIESSTATDTERADAARALASLGSAAQPELAAALDSRARVLLDEKAWLTSQHGAVLTLLEGLEPKSAETAVLAELASLSLEGDAAPVVRRKVMLRCRAAAVLAGKASASAALLACDPAPAAEQREGSLARLKVLSRGPLDKERGPRFQELARSSDRVVREAALELLMAHDEAQDIPAILAEALSAPEVGVRATAAKVLARYPGRAQTAPSKKDERPAAAPPADPRVVQALTRQLAEVGKTHNIELATLLLDAAVALELLGAKPALERACSSSNPTLRLHAERGFAALRERDHRCPNVPSREELGPLPTADLVVDFDTDVGPLTLTLWSQRSPFAVQRLAELARSGFYDGMLVHRAVPGFVVQFGDPDGDGFGAPDRPPLRCQLGFDRVGTGAVGVALAGRDTGSSQFFVTLRPTPHLSGEYSVLGQAGPGWEKLAAGDRLLRVRVSDAPDKAGPSK